MRNIFRSYKFILNNNYIDRNKLVHCINERAIKPAINSFPEEIVSIKSNGGNGPVLGKTPSQGPGHEAIR